MARTPKEPEAPKERVLPSQVLKSITQKKLKQLVASANQMKDDVDELVGTHREQIAEAVEKNNLHKGAFADAKRMSRIGRKNPGKLADHFDYRDHYEDLLGLRELAATAPRLPVGEGAGEGDGEESGGDRGKVTPFPKAAE